MNSPALPSTTAPPRPVGLWNLACLSLLVTAVVEVASAMAMAYSETLGRALGSGETFVQIASSILIFGTLLAAITPMVLAADHYAFRGALVTVHVVGAWAILIVGYAALLRFNAEFIAELANEILLLTVGIESSAPEDSLLLMPLLLGFVLAIPLAAGIWLGRCRWAWLGVMLGSGFVASLALIGEMLSNPTAATLGVPVAVFSSLVGASLLAKLQIALWQRCGWHLVRIRRGPATNRSADALESPTASIP